MGTRPGRSALFSVLRPDSFSDHLRERITVHAAPDADLAASPAAAIDDEAHAGEFVMYWMRTAVRAHENPAMDVALLAAARLGVPMFVYHALSEKYPFASDRHHTFILEGARDVEAECASRGIGYVFHLERPGQRMPALRLLAERAALVVTETFPVAPLSTLTDSLAGAVRCPVWSVDTSCIVPMPLVSKEHTRAFEYRQSTAALRKARVGAAWVDARIDVRVDAFASHATPFLPASLPFVPVTLATADIAQLVAQCDIDHGVAPVSHTRGGSAAGYARWAEFVTSGRLSRYAAARNDATIDGASRMSAYFHYGMVSTFRIVGECVAVGGAGADKYLDELLVWRELAYSFCYRHGAPDTLSAIPSWARDTLAQHEANVRVVRSWETLARGTTGDALWDAAQQSLRVHGELHNNVRMTWGKAIPLWSDDARDALDRLIDLNHRYALDGRDPASFGGLLWCLGQFDRPFNPPVPVLGTVRPRTTHEHAQRMNLPAYQAHVGRPAHEDKNIIVIGAGLAGLACARTLQDHGLPVTVVDKGRGVGGRLSSRREGVWQFDHGAPSFRLGDSRTAKLRESWLHDGVLRCTREGEYIGARGMNALPKHVASDLTVRTGFQATLLERVKGGERAWKVSDGSGASLEGDVVLLATPAPQAVALLTGVASDADGLSDMRRALTDVQMLPCWSTMLVFDAPPADEIIAQLVDGTLSSDDPLIHRAWRQSARPGRSPDEAWVVHSEGAWSAAHLERAPGEIADIVSTAMQHRLRIANPPVHAASHRWRFARVDTGLDAPCLFNAAHALGACGDWGDAGATRRTRTSVERAWLSGVALAGRVLGG